MAVSDSPSVPLPPEDDASIWRYMDFTKFIALLEDEALFFPRVAQLEDPFEGSFPAGQPLLSRLSEILPPGAIPPGAKITLSPGLDRVAQTMRAWSLVSCWHVSPYESSAMWRLYAPTGSAVAIQSTVARLRAALGKAPSVKDGIGGGEDYHIGSVEYIDYGSGRVPPDSFAGQFFRKRRSFEHERELRVLLVRYPVRPDNHFDHDRGPPSTGVALPVDLSTLIATIRVAPQVPAWYRELVEKVVHRYGLTAETAQSELDAEPIF